MKAKIITSAKELRGFLNLNGITVQQLSRDSGIPAIPIYRQLARSEWDAPSERGRVRTDSLRSHIEKNYNVKIKY